jgi:DNA-binding PadR family transcriptional regulator
MNHSKFKSLVHYVVSRRADDRETLGAVKLNKILWLADLSAYYELGRPITDSRYVKQKFGPVPARVMPALHELERDGAITIRDTDHYGKQKKEYVVHEAGSGDFLKPEERRIVDRIIDDVCDRHTAASVSDASHNHIWKAAEDGEELPLFTVFAKPGTITDVERMWAQTVLASDEAA